MATAEEAAAIIKRLEAGKTTPEQARKDLEELRDLDRKVFDAAMGVISVGFGTLATAMPAATPQTAAIKAGAAGISMAATAVGTASAVDTLVASLQSDPQKVAKALIIEKVRVAKALATQISQPNGLLDEMQAVRESTSVESLNSVFALIGENQELLSAGLNLAEAKDDREIIELALQRLAELSGSAANRSVVIRAVPLLRAMLSGANEQLDNRQLGQLASVKGILGREPPLVLSPEELEKEEKEKEREAIEFLNRVAQEDSALRAGLLAGFEAERRRLLPVGTLLPPELQSLFDTLGANTIQNLEKELVGKGAFPILSRQSGGPLGANQLALVGEGGPELFVPKSAGDVLNNEDTMSVLAAAGARMLQEGTTDLAGLGAGSGGEGGGLFGALFGTDEEGKPLTPDAILEQVATVFAGIAEAKAAFGEDTGAAGGGEEGEGENGEGGGGGGGLIGNLFGTDEEGKALTPEGILEQAEAVREGLAAT